MSLTEKLQHFEEILKQTPPEEQQQKLNELLATLSQEELDELQQQQCIICSIVAKKTPSNILYEDEQVMAVLDINPASKGHAILFPKQHHSILATLPPEELSHLYLTATNIAAAQYDILEADGTNIITATGQAAGQKLPHAIINIIPRMKDDGITLTWKPHKAQPEELTAIAEKLKPAVKPAEKILTPEPEPQEKFKDAKPQLEEPKPPRRIP